MALLIGIIEVVIFFTIAFVIITYFFGGRIMKLIGMAAKESTNENVPTEENGGLTGYFGGMTKKIFGDYAKSYINIFSGFSSAFEIIRGNMDKIRSYTRPLRNFFKNMSKQFYKTLEKGMISITYLIHKLRNALRRSVAGFNLAVHTVDHTLTFFDSFYNSPIVQTLPKIEKPLNWVGDKIGSYYKKLGIYIKEDFNENVCFHPDTLLYLKNNQYKKISDVVNGDIIKNRGFHTIQAKMEFLNKSLLLNYNDVLVTSSHLVYDDSNNIWKRIINCENAFLDFEKDNNPDRVFCLITNTHKIPIHENLFSDYIEINNPYINKSINDLILDNLNSENQNLENQNLENQNLENQNLENQIIRSYNFLNNYSSYNFTQNNYPGFVPDTKIYIDEDKTMSIKDIQIGQEIITWDSINNEKKYSKVIGKVHYFENNYVLYRYNGVLMTESTKILINIDDNIGGDEEIGNNKNKIYMWKNIVDVEYPKLQPINISLNTELFNIVVDGIIKIEGEEGDVYARDFFETHNTEINKRINEMLEEDINKY